MLNQKIYLIYCFVLTSFLVLNIGCTTSSLKLIQINQNENKLPFDSAKTIVKNYKYWRKWGANNRRQIAFVDISKKEFEIMQTLFENQDVSSVRLNYGSNMKKNDLDHVIFTRSNSEGEIKDEEFYFLKIEKIRESTPPCPRFCDITTSIFKKEN